MENVMHKFEFTIELIEGDPEIWEKLNYRIVPPFVKKHGGTKLKIFYKGREKHVSIYYPEIEDCLNSISDIQEMFSKNGICQRFVRFKNQNGSAARKALKEMEVINGKILEIA